MFTAGYDIPLWEPYDSDIVRMDNGIRNGYKVQCWEIDGVKYSLGQKFPANKTTKNLTAYAIDIRTCKGYRTIRTI